MRKARFFRCDFKYWSVRILTDLEKLTSKGKSFGEAISEFDTSEFNLNTISYQELMQLNNYDFLKKIISLSNRNELNDVVAKFPAYDIAENCLKNGYVTVKQRAAITNIFMYVQLSWINMFIAGCGPW